MARAFTITIHPQGVVLKALNNTVYQIKKSRPSLCSSNKIFMSNQKLCRRIIWRFVNLYVKKVVTGTTRALQSSVKNYARSNFKLIALPIMRSQCLLNSNWHQRSIKRHKHQQCMTCPQMASN